MISVVKIVLFFVCRICFNFFLFWKICINCCNNLSWLFILFIVNIKMIFIFVCWLSVFILINGIFFFRIVIFIVLWLICLIFVCGIVIEYRCVGKLVVNFFFLLMIVFLNVDFMNLFWNNIFDICDNMDFLLVVDKLSIIFFLCINCCFIYFFLFFYLNNFLKFYLY